MSALQILQIIPNFKLALRRVINTRLNIRGPVSANLAPLAACALRGPRSLSANPSTIAHTPVLPASARISQPFPTNYSL